MDTPVGGSGNPDHPPQRVKYKRVKAAPVMIMGSPGVSPLKQQPKGFETPVGNEVGRGRVLSPPSNSKSLSPHRLPGIEVGGELDTPNEGKMRGEGRGSPGGGRGSPEVGTAFSPGGTADPFKTKVVALSSMLHHHLQAGSSRKKTISMLKSSKMQNQVKEGTAGVIELLGPGDYYADTHVIFQQLLPNLERFLRLLLTPGKENETILGDVGGDGGELLQLTRWVWRGHERSERGKGC